ncbi:pyruvate kinase [Algoriphagus limi]|uniref:Pyruvate kinase n=1 Tax=Algoriphagus limi TaxID=2975273 RepID=A0ABT2G0Y3_9BACT|nr:pyruvate kinase [Algoriphagus limi]MCS5488927.1 pyruvate kinase [Algoriphagus limi]
METDLDSLRLELSTLEKEMVAEVERRRKCSDNIHPRQFNSWKNLIHYLTLRQGDRRDLQLRLHNAGLSALSNSESHIRHQVQAVQKRLGVSLEEKDFATCNYQVSREILSENVSHLFASRVPHHPAIMVTLDSTVVNSVEFVSDLLNAGMTVARINLAHETEKEWTHILDLIRKAQSNTKKACRIYMDLAGPKIRTKFIGKQKKLDQVPIEEGQLIYLGASYEGLDEKKDLVVSPTEIEILRFLKIGERVFIDDGKIQGIIEKKIGNELIGVRILKIIKKKPNLKPEKGINFPDSKIKINPLTDYDLEVLPFAVKHADLIGYSFVNRSRDLANLMGEMKKINEKIPSVILKIETSLAVRNLPAMLLEGMKSPFFGVMIARGDLAVEVGFERMSEVQDEILWICEAGHVPVIWATQVMETLHKSGLATRAEITDASQATMAECIMINKGPHTLEVLDSLQNIIQRMGTHRDKKRYTFRELKIASRFLSRY